MAYKNLVNLVVSDKAEAFCRYRDFLCKRNGTYDYSTTGIGWTLIDSSYAVDEDNPQLGDWFVMYSAGENGKEDLYIRLEWKNNYFKVHGFQAWDVSTHAGSSNAYNTTDNFLYNETDVSKAICVYGDLSFALLCKYMTTDHYGASFGVLEPISTEFTDTIATCSSSLTAGSDVSIAVDTIPTDWEVGREIFIRTTHNDNMATVEVEKITIKTLVGNTITADLSNDYTANSKLATHIAYHCTSSTQAFSNGNFLISGNGDSNGGSVASYLSLSSTYTCPSLWENRYVLTNLGWYGSVGKAWPYGLAGNFFRMGGIIAPMVQEDTIADLDGTVYRVKKFYSNAFIAIKEV